MDENTLDALVLLTMDPIHDTWAAIASDVIEAGVLGGEEVDAEGALECVLDANRLRIYGGEDGRAAEDLISEACKEYGYGVVRKALASRITLYV